MDYSLEVLLKILAFLVVCIKKRKNNLRLKRREASAAPGRAIDASSPVRRANTAWRQDDPATWFRQLFSPKGVIGFLFGLLLLPTLAANSYWLAIKLEKICRASTMHIFTLTLTGKNWNITAGEALSLLIGLDIAATAAAFRCAKLNLQEDSSLMTCAALSSLIALAVFEVAISFHGSMAGEENLVNASLSALLAFGMVTLSGVFGVFTIESFLIPLLLANIWILLFPFKVAIIRLQRAPRRKSRPKSDSVNSIEAVVFETKRNSNTRLIRD